MCIKTLSRQEQKKIEPLLKRGRPTQYASIYNHIRKQMKVGQVIEVSLSKPNRFFGRNIQATFRSNRVDYMIIAVQINDTKWCIKKVRREK